MRIIPAIIIFTSVCLALGGARAAAQEPPTPTVTPAPEGRIIIRVEDGLDTRDKVYFDVYEYRGGEDVDDFELRSGRDREFNLSPGRYRFVARDLAGFTHEDVRCRGRNAADDTVTGDDEATIDLHDGQVFICTFEFEEVPVATPTPSPTSTPLVATQTPVVITRERVVTVVATPTPVAVVGSAVTTIRPPSTGDAGLLD